MKAQLLLHERYQLREAAFVEIKVWQVPRAVRGSDHRYKYALAFVVEGKCVLCYDNEAGKGDHRHVGAAETAYRFTTPEQLLADFRRDVQSWRP